MSSGGSLANVRHPAGGACVAMFLRLAWFQDEWGREAHGQLRFGYTRLQKKTARVLEETRAAAVATLNRSCPNPVSWHAAFQRGWFQVTECCELLAAVAPHLLRCWIQWLNR